MDIFKRPTFTQEIAGIGRTPDVNLPGAPINLPTDLSGAAPAGGIDFGAPSMIPGQFQQTSRTASYKGANPLLAAIADFATGLGGPRGFGSGIPIAAELAQQRNQAPTKFFAHEQQQADVGTQRTLQMQQIQRQEEQDSMPLISVNQETGKVTIVNKRKVKAGDIAGGVQTFEPKKMTSEDFHHFIKGIETDYGVTFSPDEVFAISQSADNPKKLQEVAVKIMQEKQQAARARDAAAEAEKRRAANELAAEQRRAANELAASIRQEKSLAGMAARQNKTHTDDARLDKSFQFNAARVDKIRAPIEAQQERIARLSASIDQRTPQSDALIAPELLTAMAGGMGSGLRMNEAEIARIVKGRSNWESLKAALNKWRENPNAVSITDSQREQIRALVDVTQQRVSAQVNAIDEEGQNLIDAGSVEEHRKIANRLHQRLAAINAGAGTKTIETKSSAAQKEADAYLRGKPR